MTPAQAERDECLFERLRQEAFTIIDNAACGRRDFTAGERCELNKRYARMLRLNGVEIDERHNLQRLMSSPRARQMIRN